MAQNTVNFSQVKFGSYFFYKGEKYRKLEKTSTPSENAMNVLTRALVVFGSYMKVELESL